jgi:hypothetical protein
MDATLLDLIAVACTSAGVTREAINAAPFGDVTQRLFKLQQEQPKEVELAARVRAVSGMCHWSCHLERVRAAIKTNVVKTTPCQQGAATPTNVTVH